MSKRRFGMLSGLSSTRLLVFCRLDAIRRCRPFPVYSKNSLSRLIYCSCTGIGVVGLMVPERWASCPFFFLSEGYNRGEVR